MPFCLRHKAPSMRELSLSKKLDFFDRLKYTFKMYQWTDIFMSVFNFQQLHLYSVGYLPLPFAEIFIGVFRHGNAPRVSQGF